MGQSSSQRIAALGSMARRLGRHSVVSTTEAGSGHPTSCLSCAEIISVLFFQYLRFDIENPKSADNDRFVLSKGHAAPILWAAWAEAGAFPASDLLDLRKFDSPLEGHPVPRNPLVDVATGSLGQGLGVAVGMALSSRQDEIDNRVYVLLGDGEVAEGSVWEAFSLAGHQKLDNMLAIIDVNRLGQSQATMFEHDVENYARRIEAFGWKAICVDGHNVEELVDAFETAKNTKGQPTAIVARTLKGNGIASIQDKDNFHGKPIPKDQLDAVLAEIGEVGELEEPLTLAKPSSCRAAYSIDSSLSIAAPAYDSGAKVATREAYGAALSKLADASPIVVGLDGDTKNSTFSEKMLKSHPERFVECFIAEQNMVSVASGFAALGKVPFASSFACFLSRAYDQIRMAGISELNLKLCGSHCGVSIGEDGPSQMALEDLAMMRAIIGAVVLYPSDAVSAERLVEAAAKHQGIVYIRSSRPKTGVLYGAEEEFSIGGSKVHRASDDDKLTIVGAGVTLHAALEAQKSLASERVKARVIDLYSIKPIDEQTLRQAANETGAILTVEDHYPEGGLGEAVRSVLAGETCAFKQLAVSSVPRSGKPDELLAHYGIDAAGIVAAAKQIIG